MVSADFSTLFTYCNGLWLVQTCICYKYTTPTSQIQGAFFYSLTLTFSCMGFHGNLNSDFLTLLPPIQINLKGTKILPHVIRIHKYLLAGKK